MQYVRLGRSGLTVSTMALGLGLRGQGDSGEAERLIRKAFDGGVTFFDCANVYGLHDDRRNAGRSEEILGRALKSVRDEVVITSKVFSPVGPGPNDRGGSRFHIMREIEHSLRRLDTDRIDIYLLHGYDTHTTLDEQFRALDDLVRHGKVRYTGVCNYQAWQTDRALWTQERINASPLIVVQNPYSLLDRSLEREMFPLVRDAGLGVMAYSPLAVGLLTGRYRRGEAAPAGSLWANRPPERLSTALAGSAGDTVEVVRTIAARHGVTMSQVALAWVMARPEVTVAISGADTDAQMAENLAAVGLPLSPDDIAQLDAISAPTYQSVT